MQAAANTAATTAFCSMRTAGSSRGARQRIQRLQRAVVRCSNRRGGSSCLLKSWTNFENATFGDQTIVWFVLNFNQFSIWLRVFPVR